ncbi:hypothetical protein [Paraburkholderia tropica]|uniref:hypothetical protein n=1 Tax=Paraburkholderia tropica TaxID=92647 RepID=UPI001F3764FF|nr:hypothetical protein [Paraburkholderia tropica]
MKFIRKFDRWVARNTLLAYWLGLIVGFVVITAAHGLIVSDTQALRLQMATTARSAT